MPGFELCGNRLKEDVHFVELGAEFLKKLFDEDTGQGRLDRFSACALISIVHIRRAAKAPSAPVFWTRLAALAHAGVLADGLGNMSDSKKFLKWAAEHFSPSYIWHGAVDRHEAPRWNPEWIAPEHLFAELVGRAIGVLNTLTREDRPGRWKTIIDATFDRLKEMNSIAAAFFAGPFDDYRELPPSASPAPEVFNEIESKLREASNLGEVPGLFVLVNTIKPTKEIADNVLRIVSARIDEPIVDGDELPSLRMCGRIAAGARSVALAENIISRCVTVARKSDAPDLITDLFLAAIEACGAQAAAHEHRRAIGETAAKFAFAMHRCEDIVNIAAIFRVMEARDEKLIAYLSRARAVVDTKLKRTRQS
jgi:hypothetical protein